VARVDHALSLLSAAHLHQLLELSADVVGAASGDLGLLEELQKPGLHAATAHVAAHEVGRACDLVDLVEEDDAVLRQLNVAVRHANQLPHEVVDVPTHVARFGELGDVGFDERHPDELGDRAQEIRLPDARGPDQDQVLLDVVDRLALRAAGVHSADVVVVVADRHGERFLGLILTDDEAVQVRFHLSRDQVEAESVGHAPLLLRRRRWRLLGRLGLDPCRYNRRVPAREPILEELLKALLQFLRVERLLLFFTHSDT
jgi:hypothetical protein